jgi:hypothetical protein
MLCLPESPSRRIRDGDERNGLLKDMCGFGWTEPRSGFYQYHDRIVDGRDIGHPARHVNWFAERFSVGVRAVSGRDFGRWRGVTPSGQAACRSYR